MNIQEVESPTIGNKRQVTSQDSLDTYHMKAYTQSCRNKDNSSLAIRNLSNEDLREETQASVKKLHLKSVDATQRTQAQKLENMVGISDSIKTFFKKEGYMKMTRNR